MLKIALTALVTAVICFAVAAATGFAHRDRAQRSVTARVGDFLVIPAVAGHSCDNARLFATPTTGRAESL
jgi:hypothetical protein